MQAKEALAALALRQYHVHRAKLHGSRTTRPDRTNTPRTSARNDARIVAVLAFEQAIGTLPPLDQITLHLVFAFGHTYAEAAAILGCSERSANDKAKAALNRLAAELDERDLL